MWNIALPIVWAFGQHWLCTPPSLRLHHIHWHPQHTQLLDRPTFLYDYSPIADVATSIHLDQFKPNPHSLINIFSTTLCQITRCYILTIQLNFLCDVIKQLITKVRKVCPIYNALRLHSTWESISYQSASCIALDAKVLTCVNTTSHLG